MALQRPELATIMAQPSPRRKTSRAGGLAALILSSMFRFAAALTLALASALAAALAPAAFGGLRG
jgi:hypothetical protein